LQLESGSMMRVRPSQVAAVSWERRTPENRECASRITLISGVQFWVAGKTGDVVKQLENVQPETIR
jgi:hypothetical protein